MHIPDGFLNNGMAGGLLGMAAAVLGYCAGKVMKAVTAVAPQRVLAAAGKGFGAMQSGGRRVMTAMGEDMLYRMGMVASWIFAAQMFNFPIASGTSGHLIGGVFAAVLLGPFAGAVVIAIVLIIQSVMFADGGIMALGANVTNMAVIGSFVSYYLYAGLKKYLPEMMSVAVAAWFSVVAASLACSLQVGLSGTIGLGAVTVAMLKVHSLIGIAEAGITIILLKLFNREEK